MEPEKKRAKNETQGRNAGVLLDVLKDDDDDFPSPATMKDLVDVVDLDTGFSLQDLPTAILAHLISYVGSYTKDCKSLVALCATSRRLRIIAEQELEASVLKRDSFNRYNDFMFDEDCGTRLRVPELGSKWGKEYSSREKVVQKALKKANNNNFRGRSLSDGNSKQAIKDLRSGGADQIQIGDFTPQGRAVIFCQDGSCGCDWCSWSFTRTPRADWTYGWRIRATFQLISAKRAREIIGEICDLERGMLTSLYIESHLERREHPERFFVVQDPNNNDGSRRAKYSLARKAAVLLSVAEEDSIMHACISVKGHNGCGLSIHIKDVIFFHTKTSKQPVTFYYHDEHMGRSVSYNAGNARDNGDNASSSSDEEFGDY